jgi:hypothetical protein
MFTPKMRDAAQSAEFKTLARLSDLHECQTCFDFVDAAAARPIMVGTLNDTHAAPKRL